MKGFSAPVRTYRVVGLRDDDKDFKGRVIRREQDGLLLIIDKGRLGDKGKADAIRLLEDAMGRLKE